jgi:hypothetical protein
VSARQCPTPRALGTSLLCLGLSLTSACGTQLVEFGWGEADSADPEAPTVTSTYPADAASGVALNSPLTATFSEAMDAATINGTSFTLTHGSTPVSSGAVVLDEATHTATFTPAADLAGGEVYTASITTGARNTVSQALAADYFWSFGTLPFNVVASEAAARAVPVPDYTLSVAGLELLTDARNTVQSATGAAILTAGLVPGQTYLVSSVGLATYGEIDAAYGAAAQPLLQSRPSTTPVTVALPASAFALEQADLTTVQVRTLILANSVNGVRSYQLFGITFHRALRALE